MSYVPDPDPWADEPAPVEDEPDETTKLVERLQTQQTHATFRLGMAVELRAVITYLRKIKGPVSASGIAAALECGAHTHCRDTAYGGLTATEEIPASGDADATTEQERVGAKGK